MNPVVAGLNKLIITCKAADNGKTVSVTNGYNTWSKVLADNGASFLIPSIPTPERNPYTISLLDDETEEYSRTIQIGYGDTVEVGLFEEDEPANMGDIGNVEDDLEDLETRLVGRITYGTTDLVDGSSSLQEGYIYCYI